FPRPTDAPRERLAFEVGLRPTRLLGLLLPVLPVATARAIPVATPTSVLGHGSPLLLSRWTEQRVCHGANLIDPRPVRGFARRVRDLGRGSVPGPRTR